MSGRLVPVIVNPVAGGGRLLAARPALESTAAPFGVSLEWWLTDQPGHGEVLGRRAVEHGMPLVFAFGGDGTYNEVARGVLGSSTALGVLPGGTTSVLAYELAIPRPAPRALAALLTGSDRVMRVACTSNDDLVLLMLSTGPDSLVLANIGPRLRRFGARPAIALQAARVLFSLRSLPEIRVLVNGRFLTGGWAVVGKSRFYAGPFPAAPGADSFTPSLELVLQRRVGRRAAVGFALALPFARHVRRSDVERVVSDRVHLDGALTTREVPYQVDGDPKGCLPVEIWVDSRPLTVRLPRHAADSRAC